MKTTKQLSKTLEKLQEEAVKKILSFFKGQPYVRIKFFPSQDLNIDHERKKVTLTELESEGFVTGDFAKFGNGKLPRNPSRHISELSIDALLIILDELERMKKNNQLKKP
jgi:hypothetical protein